MAKFLFIQHDAACPPELGAKVLQMRNIEFQVTFAYYPNAFCRIHPTMYTGIVVLGGHLSAWEDNDHPWLKDERLFIKSALDCNVPILGLCLGAQLLANVVGATNYNGQKGQEHGFTKTFWTNESKTDKYVDFIRKNMLDSTFIYNHGDTYNLPSNKYYTNSNNEKLEIVTLANTAKYNAMFKVGDIHYGAQFHPECDVMLHHLWLEFESNSLCAQGVNVEDLKHISTQKKQKIDQNGTMFMGKWIDMCLQRAGNAPVMSKL